MKKLVLIAVAVLCILGVNAQDKTSADYKSEGIEAHRNKDYDAAFTAFEKALELNIVENKVDTPLHYNTGYCAYKIKNYKTAIKYFEKSIAFDYKTEKSYEFKANSYKKLKDNEKYAETLNAGLILYPSNTRLKKMQATRLFREGLLLYNEASENIQLAAQIVESNPEEFKVKKAMADKLYAESLPILKEAYALYPKIKNLPEALLNIFEALDMKDDATALKKELEERK